MTAFALSTAALFKNPGSRRRAGGAAVRLLAAGILLTPLALFAPGCNKADAKSDPKGAAKVPVDVAAARLGAVQRRVEVVGTLYGEEDATISNKVNGKIITIYKDVGDRAEPGEALAQLLQNDYLLDLNQKRAALNESLAKLGLQKVPTDRFQSFDVTTMPAVRRAKFQADSAEAKYQRGKQLHGQKPQPLISDQDFEDLKTASDVAKNAYDAEVLAGNGLVGEAQTHQADLLIAEQALADTTVRAPSTKYAAPDMEIVAPAADAPAPLTRPSDPNVSAGSNSRSYFIAARYASEGELEKAVTPLFRLVDDDPIKLRAAVPERYFPELRVGQKVAVKVEAAVAPSQGTVSRINPQIDPANRTFQIEAIVPNPDHLLPPGAFARGAIDTRIEPNVVFIPWSAVVTFAGVDKVFVIEDDKAQEVEVALGQRPGDEVEVKKGLKGGEKLATSGTGRLATGVPVTVKTAAIAAPHP